MYFYWFYSFLQSTFGCQRVIILPPVPHFRLWTSVTLVPSMRKRSITLKKNKIPRNQA